MGADFYFAGSISYPRMDEELTGIAKLFGGKPTKELKEVSETKDIVEYFFGSTTVKEDKYTFPGGTDKLLVKWFNHPYDDYSAKDTKYIFEKLKPFEEKIKDISDQIWYEFEELTGNNIGWRIR